MVLPALSIAEPRRTGYHDAVNPCRASSSNRDRWFAIEKSRRKDLPGDGGQPTTPLGMGTIFAYGTKQKWRATGRNWARFWRRWSSLSGCATNAVDYVGYAYYYYGPEVTLQLLDEGEIFPEDRALAEVERSVALLELGRYSESTSALSRAEILLDSGRVYDPKSPPWLPEYHERVMMETMKIADALAMQDMATAAIQADGALAAVAGVDCEPCRFDFTRVLAAMAYGGAGRFDDGLDALSWINVEGRSEELVDVLRRRLLRGVEGTQPEGLAPPPVEPERSLTMILLLGRGPYKDYDRPGDHRIGDHPLVSLSAPRPPGCDLGCGGDRRPGDLRRAHRCRGTRRCRASVCGRIGSSWPGGPGPDRTRAICGTGRAFPRVSSS